MEGDQPVDESMVNVAKYVIKKTPIGHITKTIENLNAVLGERVMDAEDVHKELHKYGETHFSQIKTEIAPQKVVISPGVKDGEGFYHDQGQKVKFKIGLDNGNIEEPQQEEYQDDLRDAIEKELDKYFDEYYNLEITKRNVYKDNSNNKIVVLISAHNLNFKNFWTGEWLSSWELNLSGNKIKGNVRANTYYYEEGNIQFNMENNQEGHAQGGDNATIAKSFIDFIKETENKIQRELDVIYDELSSNYIKVLRRKALITGSKMNWNVNQLLIGQQK